MKLQKKMRRMRAFTLVELMIVVVIVAILAMVAIPLYQGNVEAAQFSEGIAGCGTVRTAMRVYSAANGGDYPALAGVDGTGLDEINVDGNSLDGKYFDAADYLVTSDAAGFTVQVTHPTSGKTYIINQDGTESGTFTTE
jgi:prepilin-type N-terminal cleavage/methylation domain-containing protein